MQITKSLMILAIFMVGCSSPPVTLTPTATATATLMPTETPVWFPSTATVTPAPTIGVTPTSNLLEDLGSQILADDFSDPDAWGLRVVNENRAQIVNQHLTLALNSPNSALYITRLSPTLSDFYAEITANPSLCSGKNEYGLMVRVTPNLDYYRFGVSCQGSASLLRINEGKAYLVKDWEPVGGGAVLGPNGVILAVRAVGSDMEFYVNGNLVFSARDVYFYQGQFGVYARRVEATALTVNFSELNIYEVLP